MQTIKQQTFSCQVRSPARPGSTAFPESSIFSFPPNVERLYGYHPKELIGRNYSELVGPDDIENLGRDFHAAMAGRELTKEHQYLSKNRGAVWVLTRARPIYESGRIIGVQGSLTEITQRKNAEAALKESRRRDRARLDAILSPEGDIGKLKLADIVDIPAIQEIMNGFHQLTHIGVGMVDNAGNVLVAIGWQDICTKFHRLHPETKRNCVESDLRLSAGIAPGEFRAYHCRNNLWDIATPIVIGGHHVGNLFLGQFFFEDETPDRVFFRQQARRYGFDESAYLKALDRVPRWSRKTVDTVMRFYADLIGLISRLSYSNLKLGKALQDLERAGNALKNGEWRAGVVNYVAVKRDVTEALDMEEQLYQAQKMESIGRLAGGVAHDLNNLLSPILGFSELLLEDPSLMASHRESTEEIVNAGKRAKMLIRQLLAFSRRQPLQFQALDINDLVADFEKLLRRTLREDIGIHKRLASSLPKIQGDIGQLEQVVMNLAVNSQDAMPHGGQLIIETGSVMLDEHYARGKKGVSPGPYVKLAISDTGSGMDAETVRNLFEPFFTTKEKGKGTGLGMSTAYGIVKQHNGNIWAYSEPGLGTTIKVYLPVSDAAAADEPAALEQKPAETTGSEIVLLAEDDQQVRNLSSVALKRWGYTVLAAENGEEAILQFEAHKDRIRLLLTDVIMPDMNGKELYQRISAASPGLKVLYMSGYTDDVIAHHGVIDEGVNFIEKPFTLKMLASKVRAVLDESPIP